MTTTTQTIATDRLGVVPSHRQLAESIATYLGTFTGGEAVAKPQLFASNLALHLTVNWQPNADAMTKAELVNLLHDAVNDVERMDDNGDAIMPRATYNALARAYEKARRTL